MFDWFFILQFVCQQAFSGWEEENHVFPTGSIRSSSFN
jgi:hypothetical protein